MAKKKEIDIKKFFKSKNVEGSDGKYLLNGWKVKVSPRGISWHTKMEGEFTELFKGMWHFEDKSGKPFTPKKKITEELLTTAFDRLSAKKTQRALNKEHKELKEEEKQKAALGTKAAYCKGCTYSPEGEHSSMCSKMIGEIPYCSEPKFYTWYYCGNASPVIKKGEDMRTASYNCKLTKEPCPYVRIGFMGRYFLKTNVDGEHFTSCSDFQDMRGQIETNKEFWWNQNQEVSLKTFKQVKRKA